MHDFTMFDQIMKLIDQKFIATNVAITESDKWSKKFKTKDHLAIMIFAQLMNCRSLRESVIQFNAMRNKNYVDVKRSTLSDANSFRESNVFEGLCNNLIEKQNNKVTKALKILDSTPITISGRGTEWVLEKSTNHIKGLKVHIRLSSKLGKIDQVVITPPNINDISVAKLWDIIPGTINVFDKGYFDFNWWYKIHITGAFFVTRAKKNTAYKVIYDKPKKEVDTILKDQLIQLSNKYPRGGAVNLLVDVTLRLIIYYDPIHKKTYKFLTNLLTSSAQEIAAYYKTRWEIELFFKWLKQNLKIKCFLGVSENAIKIQIYAAIITYMLLKDLEQLMRSNFSRTKDFLAWIKMVICFPVKLLCLQAMKFTTRRAFFYERRDYEIFA